MRSVRSRIRTTIPRLISSSLATLAVLIAGCGAEPGAGEGPLLDEIASLQAPLSTTWAAPFAASSWRIGFDIYNSALAGQRSSCFGTTMDKIKHAGEDWAGSTSTKVGAIGAGVVVYAEYVPYPGSVVVIRHDLSEAQRLALGLSTRTIYSQYGHLTGLLVTKGNNVSTGQQIGTLLNQSTNTHLHWEIRTYEKPPLCGTTAWGPGYTGPGTTATSYGYLNPSVALRALQGAGGVSWDCRRSEYMGRQYWTCSGGNLYRCEAGVAKMTACARGCAVRPTGTDDVCN